MKTNHNHPTRIRRGLTFLALAAVLGVSAMGLTQCRFVDDSITGVDLKSTPTLSARSGCQRRCKDAYKTARRAEEKRHKEADKACGRDEACKRAEKQRYETAKRAINQALRDCKRGCYNEGAGVGGRP